MIRAWASRIIGWLDAVPYWLLALPLRLAIATVFWNSGTAKLANWDTTLTLFAANNIAINAAITSGSAGGLTLIAGNGITAIAAVNVGTFTLQNGNWVQLGPSLPAFAVNDFRITGGSLARSLIVHALVVGIRISLVTLRARLRSRGHHAGARFRLCFVGRCALRLRRSRLRRLRHRGMRRRGDPLV